MSAALAPELSAESFRRAMGRVCTPVAVVTASNGVPHGTTVSAFSSLSLAPPMILVALDRGSELLARLTQTRRFGVNVLARDQSHLARRFARKGHDTFADLAWCDESGCPRFEGAAVWLGCRVADMVEGGDHRVALGVVMAVNVRDAEPLTYHAQEFGTHTPVEASLR